MYQYVKIRLFNYPHGPSKKNLVFGRYVTSLPNAVVMATSHDLCPPGTSHAPLGGTEKIICNPYNLDRK